MSDLVANRGGEQKPAAYIGRQHDQQDDLEGPLGADIQNLLEIAGIQQDLLDPVLGLVGSLGGMFTS